MTHQRQLRDDERELLRTMLASNPSYGDLISKLDACVVEDMQDGGMGSIRFVSSGEGRHLGITIAEAEYTDADGVLVSIALNTDSGGGLYEVDFWKVDFSPLRRYPSAQDLRLK